MDRFELIVDLEENGREPLPKCYNEDDFWRIIEEARKQIEEVRKQKVRSRTSQMLQVHILTSLLTELSQVEIVNFHDFFHENQRPHIEKLYPLISDGHSGVRYVSGDNFHYFHSWLIGEGREVFLSVKKEPQKLLEFYPDIWEWPIDLHCNEGLEYAASYAWRRSWPGVEFPTRTTRGKPNIPGRMP